MRSSVKQIGVSGDRYRLNEGKIPVCVCIFSKSLWYKEMLSICGGPAGHGQKANLVKCANIWYELRDEWTRKPELRSSKLQVTERFR